MVRFGTLTAAFDSPCGSSTAFNINRINSSWRWLRMNKIRKKERERERERERYYEVRVCVTFFRRTFFSTFSPLDQAFQRCCAEVTLNPQQENFKGIWGGGGGGGERERSDLLKNASWSRCAEMCSALFGLQQGKSSSAGLHIPYPAVSLLP